MVFNSISLKSDSFSLEGATVAYQLPSGVNKVFLTLISYSQINCCLFGGDCDVR